MAWYQIGRGYYGISPASSGKADTVRQTDKDQAKQTFDSVFSIPTERIRIEPARRRVAANSAKPRRQR